MWTALPWSISNARGHSHSLTAAIIQTFSSSTVDGTLQFSIPAWIISPESRTAFSVLPPFALSSKVRHESTMEGLFFQKSAYFAPQPKLEIRLCQTSQNFSYLYVFWFFPFFILTWWCLLTAAVFWGCLRADSPSFFLNVTLYFCRWQHVWLSAKTERVSASWSKRMVLTPVLPC